MSTPGDFSNGSSTTETASVFDAIVIGAGIGGLAAAWKLASAGKRVLLLDKSHHPGGVIQSVFHKGYLLEKGPNSYSSFGKEEEDFLKAIGLKNRALRRPLKTTDRYIWHSGVLHRVPTGPLGFAFSPILSPQARLKMLLALFTRYTKPTRHSSLGHWMRNLIGNEAVETLLKPFFGGIYAANADQASFADCAPTLYDAVNLAPSLAKVPFAMKAQRGGAPKPKMPKALTSFPHGLSELPNATAQAFCSLGGIMHLGVEARISQGNQNHRFSVSWSPDYEKHPHTYHAHTDQIILATPSNATGHLLESVSPNAASVLKKLPSVTLNVVHVGVRTRHLTEQRSGFGFLTRRNERIRMLGAIWTSRIFKGRVPIDKTLLTCFYGGELDPEGNSLSDAELRLTVLQDLQKTMGYIGPKDPAKGFEVFQVTRWRPALALYRLGHGDEIAKLKQELPAGIQLVSGYLGRPALPDRIKAGWAAADSLLGSSESPKKSTGRRAKS